MYKKNISKITVAFLFLLAATTFKCYAAESASNDDIECLKELQIIASQGNSVGVEEDLVRNLTRMSIGRTSNGGASISLSSMTSGKSSATNDQAATRKAQGFRSISVPVALAIGSIPDNIKMIKSAHRVLSPMDCESDNEIQDNQAAIAMPTNTRERKRRNETSDQEPNKRHHSEPFLA